MWKRCGLSTRGRESERGNWELFYCGDVGRHPMFCFAFRQRVRKRDWIGLLSAGSPVIYSMVILALPLHSLSLSFALSLSLPPHPVHLSHTQPYSISLFLALHLVQYKDDKVTHLRLNFPAVLEAQDQSAYTEKMFLAPSKFYKNHKMLFGFIWIQILGFLF